MEIPKKPRIKSKNWTFDEKLLLAQLVAPEKHVIECNITNMKSNQAKDEAWNRVAENFSRQSVAGITRTADSIRQCYAVMKSSAKKEKAEAKQQMFMTGGGRNTKELSALNTSILALLANQGQPLVNRFDSGAEYHDAVTDTFDSRDAPLKDVVVPLVENQSIPVFELPKSNTGSVDLSVAPIPATSSTFHIRKPNRMFPKPNVTTARPLAATQRSNILPNAQKQADEESTKQESDVFIPSSVDPDSTPMNLNVSRPNPAANVTKGKRKRSAAHELSDYAAVSSSNLLLH